MDVTIGLVHGALLPRLGEQITLTEADFTWESDPVREQDRLVGLHS